MKRLAIITTHPIQYNAPWFAMLAKNPGIKLKVFYTWSQKEQDNFDTDFKQKIDWDIPLLEGYDYKFVQNSAKNPGLHHYKGIDCPSLNKEIENWQATHLLVFGWNYKAHFKTMRYFKGKISILFRGDSTLLNYEIRNLASVFKSKNLDSQFSKLKSFIKFNLRKAFLTYIYSKIDIALYVGTNNKDYFLIHGIKENQLIFVPHAIDNNRFFDSPEKQYEEKSKRWRKKLGINEDDIVLLYAGKFEPRKNLLFFVESFNEFCLNTSHKFKLILLGNGPQEKDISVLVNKNKDNIIRLPFQNQSRMPIVYRLADFYCLPSKSETWGLAVNEALACDRPVLVSDKVGCAKDLINRNTGLVFDYKDKASLQNQLLNFNIKKPQWDASFWSFHNISKNIIAYLNS